MHDLRIGILAWDSERHAESHRGRRGQLFCQTGSGGLVVLIIASAKPVQLGEDVAGTAKACTYNTVNLHSCEPAARRRGRVEPPTSDQDQGLLLAARS